MRKISCEELDNRLKIVYPHDDLTFISYKNMKSNCEIQCNSCGTIYNMYSAESAFRKKYYFCPKCNDTPEWKRQKEEFKKWLDDHSNEFILVDDLDKIHNSQAHIRCKCTKCGLIQENKKIYDYYNGKKCFCQNKGTKKPKEILEEELKEQGYELLEDYINTDIPILMKRLECGHIFKGYISSMLKDKYYCPCCHFSKGEKIIEEFLISHNINYIPQYKIQTYKPCYIDFYLPNQNLFLEFNGKQHYDVIEYFGGEQHFKEQVKRDNSVREYCNKNNINLLEISYLDFKNINGILEENLR